MVRVPAKIPILNEPSMAHVEKNETAYQRCECVRIIPKLPISNDIPSRADPVASRAVAADSTAFA